MKERTKKPFLRIIYRLLFALVLVLILLLAAGTLYALVFRPGVDAPETAAPPVQAAARESGRMFSGLGRLRIPLADSAALIFSPVFPYDPDDRAFSEELALRIKDFRSIARDYFSAQKADELRDKKEEEIKDELLRLFNAVLRLGRIELLYFTDYMIVE